MKKKLILAAILTAAISQPSFAYQQNDGTGSNGNNGGRNSGFCSTVIVMPFGFVFKPCLFFG